MHTHIYIYVVASNKKVKQKFFTAFLKSLPYVTFKKKKKKVKKRKKQN